MADLQVNTESAISLANNLGHTFSNFDAKKNVWDVKLYDYINEFSKWQKQLTNQNTDLNSQISSAKTELEKVKKEMIVLADSIEVPGTLNFIEGMVALEKKQSSKEAIEEFINEATSIVNKNEGMLNKIAKKIYILAVSKNELEETKHIYQHYSNLKDTIYSFIEKVIGIDLGSSQKLQSSVSFATLAKMGVGKTVTINETDLKLSAVIASTTPSGLAFFEYFNKNSFGIPIRTDRQFLEIDEGENAVPISAINLSPQEMWKVGKKVEDINLVNFGFTGSVDNPEVLLNQKYAGAFANIILDARRNGIDLRIGSDYRSNADQFVSREFNHCDPDPTASASTCDPPTAPVGQSEHESGEAVDWINSNGDLIKKGSPEYEFLTQTAAKYGIKNWPVESWHWSTTGS